MSPEDIRAVTGHTTAGMMMKYVKFDDESKREKMSLLNNGQHHGVETVFDHAVTDDERMRLGIPTREAYLERVQLRSLFSCISSASLIIGMFLIFTNAKLRKMFYF